MKIGAERQSRRHVPSKLWALNRDGAVIVEFAATLPILVVALLGLADLGVLLQKKVTMIHISREAASAFSRGASAAQTVGAVLNADEDLDLDGPNGKLILTEVTLDPNGNPIVVAQTTSGGLAVQSAIGTLPPGASQAAATIPNGQQLPAGMTLYAVEVFSKRSLLFGLAWSDRAVTTMGSLAAF